MGLLETVLVPIAHERDAEATCEAALPPLEGTDLIVAVHVIEKSGGFIDKAPLEQREEQAEEVFAMIEECFAGSGIDLETRLVYDTDVVEGIVETAGEVGATSIAFSPRSGGRLTKLLSGDVWHDLVKASDTPVIVLPKPAGTD